jgi:hypothetical protein
MGDDLKSARPQCDRSSHRNIKNPPRLHPRGAVSADFLQLRLYIRRASPSWICRIVTILQKVQDKSAILPFSRIILQKVQQIPGVAAQAGDYPAGFAA